MLVRKSGVRFPSHWLRPLWQYVNTVISFSNKLFHVLLFTYRQPILKNTWVLIACGTIKPIVPIFHSRYSVWYASNRCVFQFRDSPQLNTSCVRALRCSSTVNIAHSNYKLIYIWVQKVQSMPGCYTFSSMY